MKIAGYVRVSTEIQKEQGSHENQRQRLEDWAEREGHDIDIFEDIAISGQSDQRQAYNKMIKKCKEGKYDMVVVRELSRFGRNLKTVLEDIEQLAENNVKFKSLRENFETESAMGRVLLQMIGVFNEFWSNISRERAIESAERRKQQGLPVGRPRKLSKKEEEELRWLREEKGLSYTALGKYFDVSRSTAYKYFQRTKKK